MFLMFEFADLHVFPHLRLGLNLSRPMSEPAPPPPPPPPEGDVADELDTWAQGDSDFVGVINRCFYVIKIIKCF